MWLVGLGYFYNLKLRNLGTECMSVIACGWFYFILCSLFISLIAFFNFNILLCLNFYCLGWKQHKYGHLSHLLSSQNCWVLMQLNFPFFFFFFNIYFYFSTAAISIVVFISFYFSFCESSYLIQSLLIKKI